MQKAVEREVFKHLFSSVAEEMGVRLQRSAFSPNIKERRDFSCAVFDEEGHLVAQAAHIPVHLGAMPLSVEACRRHLTLGPGDVAILNDPFHGGTHLPDITIVSPVFVENEGSWDSWPIVRTTPTSEGCRRGPCRCHANCIRKA